MSKKRKREVVADEVRLTTEERKRIFADNLDRLIRLVGMTRIQAAEEIDVPYRLVRRLVSMGAGRLDDRTIKSVKKLAEFFTLGSADELWRGNLIVELLSAERPSNFIKRFRAQLLAERERRLAEEGARSHDELSLLSLALGFEATSPKLTGPYADKVASILASPKAAQFKRLVDDYYELAVQHRRDE